MSTPRRAQGLAIPRLNFHVTAEHIARAKRADSEHCMIADALRDWRPEAAFISVDLQTIRFTDERAGRRYVYLTPPAAQAALIDWDQGLDVEPFRVRQACAQVTGTAGTRRKRAQVNAGTGTPRKPEVEDEAKPARKVRQGRLTVSSNGSVPTIVGGDELPAPRRGRRREFGLRALIR